MGSVQDAEISGDVLKFDKACISLPCIAWLTWRKTQSRWGVFFFFFNLDQMFPGALKLNKTHNNY